MDEQITYTLPPGLKYMQKNRCIDLSINQSIYQLFNISMYQCVFFVYIYIAYTSYIYIYLIYIDISIHLYM